MYLEILEQIDKNPSKMCANQGPQDEGPDSGASALAQHLRTRDDVLGLNLFGGGEAPVTTSSEESEAVEDIEHSEESEEGASEEEDVWSRCVTTSNPYGL